MTFFLDVSKNARILSTGVDVFFFLPRSASLKIFSLRLITHSTTTRTVRDLGGLVCYLVY